MNSSAFTFESLPHRVLAGAGRIVDAGGELDRLSVGRILIITTEGRRPVAERLKALAGGRDALIHDRAVQHVPRETVDAAVREATSFDADGLVAVGGGSTTGLAKAVALELKLPILAVPTTLSGSEMTAIWGISDGGSKTTGRDRVVKPRSVIYDPELLVSMPPDLTLTSGINAMAHAVEALYAEDADPVSTLLAEESVRLLTEALPTSVAAPGDLDARSKTLQGAMLAAMVLDSVGMALHHKLAHVVGGSFSMPHAPTHTVLLPYAVSYNRDHAPRAMDVLGRVLGCPADDTPGALQDLVRDAGGPVALRDIGFPEDGIDRAAREVADKPYYNPRPVEQDAIRELLQRAWRGKRP